LTVKTKLKEQRMKTNRKGFTLVEIMIVVAIIGILAAIAIPNFIKSRKESQKNACIANLKQIEGAVEQAKMAGKTSPVESDIVGATCYIKITPLCPSTKATYSIAPGTDATWRPVCPNSAVNGSDTTDLHILPTT
jgi:prepilin-type N-terminal cleavage/methylation domain-containing protein